MYTDLKAINLKIYVCCHELIQISYESSSQLHFLFHNEKSNFVSTSRHSILRPIRLKMNWIKDTFSNTTKIQHNIDSNSRYYIIVWVRLIRPINQSKARSIPNTFCTPPLHTYVYSLLSLLYTNYITYDARQFSPISIIYVGVLRS